MSKVPHDPREHGAALRVKALEQLLTERGLIDPAALDELVETYEKRIGPHIGAKVIARAWTDEAFKKRALENGTYAISEMGFGGMQGEDLVCVANSPEVHNVIVCTLCSCYPWAVLGLPPNWYKSAPYRSRVVIDPRGVLLEFGLELPPEKQIRVWDSTAELRYVVIPERPEGTSGWDEGRLATLVTRNCLIGTGLPLVPR